MAIDDKDIEQIKGLITAANKPISDAVTQLTESQKATTAAQADLNKNVSVLADTLKNLPPAAAAKGDKKGDDVPADEKPLTAAEVKELLKQDREAAQTSQEVKAKRSEFISKEMKGLMPAYAERLGNDPTKWADEAKDIRQQYEGDLKAQGFKPVDVGGGGQAQGQGPNSLPVDLSKMTPGQQREAALAALPKVGTAPATNTVVVAPAGTAAAAQ